MDHNQIIFLIIFSIVIVLWLFSKVPLFISGIIGVSLSILTGVAHTKNILASFAHPLIFVFLGGYLFAEGISSLKLDQRISLKLLSLNIVRKNPNFIFLVIFSLTFFFSMWISNTATTAMMLPIVLGVLSSLQLESKKLESLVLLGVAYSANIGGITTPIGSTPNILAMAMLDDIADIQVTFFSWMKIAFPLALLFMVVLYQYIKRFIPKVNVQMNDIIKDTIINRLSKKDKVLILLFFLMVFCWFLPSFISIVYGIQGPQYLFFKQRLHPGTVALFFSSLLFIFPKIKSPILNINSLKKIDWSSLLLFGSGLALGKIFFDSGLAKTFGDYFIENITGAHIINTLFAVTFLSIFATEISSNTATANILLPIVISIALTIEASPFILASAVAISCSLAFMLPVATPPNIIVYGSGKVQLKDMISFGIFLNIVYALLIILIFYAVSLFLT